MPQHFDLFLSQLAETNSTLGSFTDFVKIKKKIAPILVKLTQLNYLIGKEDLGQAVKDVYKENKSAFQVLSILIAVRESRKVVAKNGHIVLLKTYFETSDKVIDYIEETGLADILKNKSITNLVDYVFGVEVGLDSNARKNRGGAIMEAAVARQFDRAKINYRMQVSIAEFADIRGLGGDLKVFDFVIKTKGKTYFIEVNFYNGGGSKLNETARSYSDIAPKIRQCPNYEFVWITDGQGWLSAKNKLKEAYRIIPHLYNLTTLKTFISIVKAETS